MMTMIKNWIGNVWKYFKRIGCAILNRKCSDDCDCNVK
jgi:hypothetical protein